MSLGLTMLYLLKALPYSELFFDNMNMPFEQLCKLMLDRKKQMTPESYCNGIQSRALYPFFIEVMKMKYDEEPFYGHLQFLLTKPLLKLGQTPNNCVFNSINIISLSIENADF